MNIQLLAVEQMLNEGLQPTCEELKAALDEAKSDDERKQAVIEDMQKWLGKLLYAHLLQDVTRILVTLEFLKNQHMLVIPTEVDTIH